jgi:hypothetical protein
LVQLLEHLICDHKVDKGLLNGKVFSVCKQWDTPNDAIPVEMSCDSVSQPVTKKPTGKVAKGGMGLWVPPDIISPK